MRIVPMIGLTLALAWGFAATAVRAQAPAPPEVAPDAYAREVPDAAKSEFARKLFGADVAASKSHACFNRRYDAAHLARHPAQTVQAMTVLVSAARDAETGQPVYDFQMQVQFRQRKGTFASGGNCAGPLYAQLAGDTLRLGCGVDCDGGNLTIFMTGTDRSIQLVPDALRLVREDADNGAVELPAPGADDRLFRLDRAAIEACKKLLPEDEEPATN